MYVNYPYVRKLSAHTPKLYAGETYGVRKMLEVKKKLVGYIVKEYWDKICPICGNTNLPHIQEFDERDKLHIEICCSGCNLTVSFKLPYDLFTKEVNAYLNELNMNAKTCDIT